MQGIFIDHSEGPRCTQILPSHQTAIAAALAGRSSRSRGSRKADTLQYGDQSHGISLYQSVSRSSLRCRSICYCLLWISTKSQPPSLMLWSRYAQQPDHYAGFPFPGWFSARILVTAPNIQPTSMSCADLHGFDQHRDMACLLSKRPAPLQVFEKFRMARHQRAKIDRSSWWRSFWRTWPKLDCATHLHIYPTRRTTSDAGVQILWLAATRKTQKGNILWVSLRLPTPLSFQQPPSIET